jgi:hypothetical protein
LRKSCYVVLVVVLVWLGSSLTAWAAPPAAEVLYRLLDKSVEDKEVQEMLKSLGSLTIRQRNKISLYKFFDDGIQLVVNHQGLIQAIVLYSEGAYNFRQYRGELPQGLSFTDTRAMVINKLGKPDEETTTLDKHRVDVFAKHHLAVSYKAGEERNNGLRVFVLFIRKDY